MGLTPEVHGCGLRRADHVASIAAGLLGGLVDLRKPIAGCLTDELRHRALDERFKDKARVVTGATEPLIAIDNARGGGLNHRMVGGTHDVARLLETVRLVREGRFESAVKGVRKSTTTYCDDGRPYLTVESASDALILVLMHWSADFFSSQSLPLPGWSKLAEVDDREFSEWVMRVWRDGANLRALVSQVLSNLSGIVLIDLLLHVYRYLSLFWVEGVALSRDALSLKSDLRFRWMLRNAALAAFGVSTGNALLRRDPFSLNYLSVTSFVGSAVQVEKLLDARLDGNDMFMDQLLTELQEGR